MPDANDHARVILAACIPARRDLLDKALKHLSPEHFLDPTLRTLFMLLQRYVDVTGAVIPYAGVLEDLLRASGADAGKIALYSETYDALAQREVADHEFTWSLQQVRDLAAEKATGEALAAAMQVLKSGVQDKDETLRGHAAARRVLLERFAEIDRSLSMQDAPEGETRQELDEMVADYAERKRAHSEGRSQGILLGIPELDFKIGGFQPGELNLLAGYSSDGKTSLAVQLAWSAQVEQGKNVLIFTTETLRPQVRRKLLSRHSRLPQFELPDGLDSRWLKDGTVPEALEPKVFEVASDWTKNPTYGKCYIAQVPRGASIEHVEARALRLQRLFHIDLIIIDYLRLLSASRRRQSDREELGTIIVESKGLATTFDDGRGVPVFSPWQVNRTARDNAERAGYYTSASLAETAEATNTADVILSILAPSDNEDRFCEIRAQILKNRDGQTANSIPLRVDYATSWFTSATRASGLESSSGPSADPTMEGLGLGSEFDSLLGGD